MLSETVKKNVYIAFEQKVDLRSILFKVAPSLHIKRLKFCCFRHMKNYFFVGIGAHSFNVLKTNYFPILENCNSITHFLNFTQNVGRKQYGYSLLIFLA